MQRLYDDFAERASIFVVYIAEAHSVDGWQTDSNEQAGIRVSQHQSATDRNAAARLCTHQLGLRIPVLIDGMDNAAAEEFSAWPERIYIVNCAGNIHYRGGPGPFEFDPEEARVRLSDLCDAVC